MNSISIMSIFLTAGAVAGFASLQAGAQQPSTFKVYASGLEGPRGLRFGPDGLLYVAEAGTGGTTSTGTACQQVPAPIGPYTGGKTARISRIGQDGSRTTVASGFPSTLSPGGNVIVTCSILATA